MSFSQKNARQRVLLLYQKKLFPVQITMSSREKESFHMTVCSPVKN